MDERDIYFPASRNKKKDLFVHNRSKALDVPTELFNGDNFFFTRNFDATR